MKLSKALTCLFLAAAAGTAQAQDYPARPIRMVVPFAAGGVVDVTARLLAQKLTERLGWNVIVENKPGGNGFIAVNYVAQAPADGYTLLMAHTGEFSVNPALFKNVPYNLERDFKPITLVSDTPLLLVSNANTPYKTFDDVIKAAKANPGGLSFSSPGSGSYNHLGGEWLALEAGIKLMHIPYKGGAPAMAAVAGGEVPLGVVAVPAVLPHVKTGRVHVIGLLTQRTMADHPEWKTAQGAGIPRVDASNWVGMFAPKNTPDAIVETLHREVAKTLAAADVVQRFADAGATVGGMPPAQFKQRIEFDLQNVRGVIERAKIEP
ncbi:Tripartite tricarboxylate transporter family receptor [Pigmentiphaga humi]|uniref:Tripartite tricarboxylate transporter family receptor n=1 Tax=Pigmentiphaga humi TaxID=2478468 RepID=A0A3P4B3S0_9BURK|nr:tripartite tricarboxylate transporter substrate binding protein [Pigmentiphaga humi]VCU70939.1 Tripartite tricarboxylate transporter family receptor [Pigmentiphaga humi]